MDKKKLILWSLYDFANSFVFIIFFLYYSQWLVVDRGISDFWFNMTFVGSSLLFIITVPAAASIADRAKTQLPGLRITTLLSIAFFFVTGLIAALWPGYYLWSIITFSLATYFYLFAFTFYNPILNQIAAPEHRGLASGWGWFGSWLGEMIGLLIALPFASGAIKLWGEPGRVQTFIPAVILFFIFASPLLFFFKEEKNAPTSPANFKDEFKNIFKSFKALCAIPGVGLFFLAYFFFNDAITTASNNFPIYVENLFSVSDEVKSYLLIGILITSAIGSPLSGWIADRVGLKKTLLWVLGGFIVVFPLLAIAKTIFFFAIVSIVMGLWFGAIWTITRAYLTRLTPPRFMNQSFTYYTLMERLATFIGPISWGLIVTYLPRAGAFNYRAAAMVMTLFVIIGLIFARKLPDLKSAVAGLQ